MNFLRMDLSVLSGAMAAGMLTSRGLVLEAMARIAEADAGADGHGAVLELNPDALFWADRMDELRRGGGVLGPLHGLPVLLKDNVSTRDGMHTSAGSLALSDNFAAADAEIARRLRAAGAVILGKTNMTELANYVSEEMPNGFSSRGGQVKSPFPGADPSGSSTGSAVAVAAHYCPMAVGTETCGSIIAPAAQAGIVGLKPTLGLVSRRGIVPISHTLDTAGPLARTVRDAALLLGALAGPDPEDPAVTTAPVPDYLSQLNGDLTGLRVGICGLYEEEAEAGQLKASQKAAELLAQRGAACFPLQMDKLSWGKALDAIMCHEFRCGLNRYLHEYGQSRCKTLEDIISWNRSHEPEAIPYGQQLLLNAQALSGTLTEPAYLAALAHRETVAEALDEAFAAQQADVILILSGALELPALTGFPDITVPMGPQDDGLPRGALLAARRFDEQTLLRAAYGLEQAVRESR